MIAFQFGRHRIDPAQLRQAFAPRKPRHRLLKVAVGVIGLAVVLALVFLGVFVGIAMLAIGVLARLWRLRDKPLARAQHAGHRVLDGQYRVLTRPALPRA